MPAPPQLAGVESDEAQAHIVAGDALLLEDELIGAGRAYLRAVALLNRVGDRQAADVYLRLVAVSSRRGRPGVAQRHLERAAAAAPDHPGVLRRLVAWLAERDAWEELPQREDALFRAIADDPIGLELELLRSGDRWWRRAGDVLMARQRYEWAVARFPSSERARVRLGALARSVPAESGFAPASQTPPPFGESLPDESAPPESVTRLVGELSDRAVGGPDVGR